MRPGLLSMLEKTYTYNIPAYVDVSGNSFGLFPAVKLEMVTEIKV